MERLVEFLKESNLIEGVDDEPSLDDAISAWEYLLEKDTLTKENICEAHSILMGRIDNTIAGKIRKVNVRIGRRVAPNWTLVERMFDGWVYSYEEINSVEQIKEAHIEFENIHPFEDGNGRIGRIILNWQRVKNNLPILVIKSENKNKYYQWFNDLV